VGLQLMPRWDNCTSLHYTVCAALSSWLFARISSSLPLRADTTQDVPIESPSYRDVPLTTLSPAPPARRSSPPPSSAIIISSDSDSASEGKKLSRAKKAAKPKSKPVQLADWTKRGVPGLGRNRKRGSTEEKRSGSATDAM
jgi:hypothetical protein